MTRARAGKQPDPGTQPGGLRTAPPPAHAAHRHLPEEPSVMRRGERGCCRAVVHADRQRLVRSFVRDGLRRGDRVAYLCGDDGAAQRALASAGQDAELRTAIARGTLAVLHPQTRCGSTRRGVELLASVHEEHRRALDDGLTALSVTGDMCDAVVAGELDIASAGDLSSVLAAHFHGPLRLDLADLTFADVVGVRALRGRIGQRLTIVAVSDQVRRLIEVLGWDTDPAIAIVPVAA